jgi:cyclopropane fatty-acyl-phospholipid synthase-like methyltransferase
MSDKTSVPSSGRFFNEFADTFDTFYDGKRSATMQWVDQRFRRDMFVRFQSTFDFLGDLTGRRVLDIGCGSGPYIAEALRRGAAHITGIDPAPRMLELARSRVAHLGGEQKVELLLGSFPESCPQERFDDAIVMGLMDYVEDAPSFMRALKSVVEHRAVLSFPSIHWFRTPLRKLRYRVRHCPVRFYRRDEIEGLAQGIGVRGYQLTKIPGAGMDYVLCLTMS